MLRDGKIMLGMGVNGPAYLLPEMATRHGLIAGAPETGKTTCMKLLAEGFSDLGIPVLAMDPKGDLSGFISPGIANDTNKKRWIMGGVSPDKVEYKSYPTIFWDAFSHSGHPVRLDLGNVHPMIIGRFMGLDELQIQTLKDVYQISEENGLEFDDLDDLRTVLLKIHTGDESIKTLYSHLDVETVGEIRRLATLFNNRGGSSFFGRPELNISDWVRRTRDGKGYINIFNVKQLHLNHEMYSAYLVWILMELDRVLPARAAFEKPVFAMLVDEAELLFKDCSRQMMNCIEQLFASLSSKGVAVFLQTEKPIEIPDAIKAYLKNKILMSLNAYTPYEQDKVPAVISGFKPNPNFDLANEVMIMKKGEGVVSLVDEEGIEGDAEKIIFLPPQSSLGAADMDLIAAAISSSDMKGRYDNVIDYYSAKEMLSSGPFFPIMDF